MRKRLFDKEKYKEIKILVNREDYDRVSKKIKDMSLNLSDIYSTYIEETILEIEKIIDKKEKLKTVNRFYYKDV
ncbi:hypothetical protein [Sulfurimonas sp.]|uniref:hypothetical protein n=1 Tax=Sulfurimonas sp. TaxID=2022749 RepID=UPI0025F8E079|nr:hypothetical protein [Sulfurimonas sp.]MBW6488444.1 hypothetical protein [Sulfurimonas sp.]